MERLTMIDGIGNDELIRCMSCSLEKAGDNLENCGGCEEGWQRALTKLAAYEDTGLEPEQVEAIKIAMMGKSLAEITEFEGVPIDHIIELAQADKEGRVVVMPRKAAIDPRDTGRWEQPDDGDGIICPECHEDWGTMSNETERFRYCPNCGEPMIGKEDAE